MQSEISDRFRALAALPESQLGLAEGALVLASEVRPEVDIASGLETLADLAERAQPLVDSAATPSAAIAALNHSLFELEQFRGNHERYDDPRNSFLDEVLTRRRGLPITLSVLYVEVARLLGYEAYGISFPGHFLSKVVGVTDVPEYEIIVDPFFGRTLSLDECAERIRAAAGDDVDLDSRWLRPATANEIYVRMLNNLKLHYLRQGDGLGALGSFDRIVVLAPESAHEYRDRGMLLERMDCIHAAIEDYSRFLELAPRDESARPIRLRRDALSSQKPALN
ncbi:MAG: tetratricopeptide repeat protein [bacterium]|nr:tetratricopeptide repeat protein [bacterium]